MEYQENIQKRITIFEDTLLRCEHNTSLLSAIQRTRENTLLYREPLKTCTEFKKTSEKPVKVSVSLRGIFEAAKRLHLSYTNEKIGVLNFASGSSPGGGVIRGRHTQEESLCRCSTLYPCLNTTNLQKNYYDYHKKEKNLLYTNTCIFTPEITVFKKDGEWPLLYQESEWFFVDVISCPAPNLRDGFADSCNYTDHVHPLITEEQIKKLLQNRIRGMLQVAVQCNIHILVLGAFDCGAFPNSPYMAAEIYKDILKEFTHSFREIEFAIHYTPADKETYDIFSSLLLPER